MSRVAAQVESLDAQTEPDPDAVDVLEALGPLRDSIETAHRPAGIRIFESGNEASIRPSLGTRPLHVEKGRVWFRDYIRPC